MTGTSRRFRRPVARFVALESSSALVLLVATLVAVVWANSPWSSSYSSILDRSVTIGSGSNAFHMSVHEFVDEVLMVVFFLVVGLEMKRELVVGELRDRRTAALPVIAAIGGMIVPALVYVALNAGTVSARGWGIPMATDIAFALGVLAVLGTRLPPSLKLFLLSLAVVDDLGAIAVIAIFYSSSVSAGWLIVALGVLALLVVLRTLRVASIVPYLLVGVVAWYCTYRSGVHATIAGVAVGLLIPLAPVRRDGSGGSMATRLEDRLHPWSTWIVVPLFALANAGVALGTDALRGAIGSRVAWGVLLGLVVGKTIGVGAAAWLAVRTGLAARPRGVTGLHMLGVSMVAGIGFTVALFVTGLAFADPVVTERAQLAVLGASVVAALAGLGVLRVAAGRTGVEDLERDAAEDAALFD